MVPAQPPGAPAADADRAVPDEAFSRDERGVEERSARVVLRRPAHWTSDVPPGTDLRVVGDSVSVSVRSRPSDNSIADENLALLGRLPGAVDGVLIVGADPWSTAGAPARLVEYTRPSESGALFVSHLLIATGRHRVEVVAERPIESIGATDGVVFEVLDSVRAVGQVRGGDRFHETFPPIPSPSVEVGVHLDADAFALLQGLAGRRWNPSTLRAPGARQLIEQGLIGRFGTMPPATSALLEPWVASTRSITLEQQTDQGVRSRVQTWAAPEADGATVVDGTDESGYDVGVLESASIATLLALRLDVRPSWTWPFRRATLPEGVLSARLDGSPAGLPAAFADDEVLERFWSAPWTVSHLRATDAAGTATFVYARGIGHARVGRTSDGATAFRAEAPANVYRRIARALFR